ncbi:hypothetical protein TWF225_010029 [Orbilia oligospora]|nr:hypothetical protein TWF225_010029 [Orbilia oligospora]
MQTQLETVPNRLMRKNPKRYPCTMEVKREEVDLEVGEQRYFTHCAILASLPTEHSKNEKDAQLSTIRGTDGERLSAKTHQLDRLLDSLASLLVAHGRGDCVAVALGGLTKDKITLLLSIDTPVLEREASVLYEAIEAHSQKIFRYLRNFHNAADDSGLQQNVRTDFIIQQMIYSIDKIESRYKLFDRELKKIRKLDLGKFEFYDVAQEETVHYVPALEYDNAEDESLAKDLRQSFFALEGVKKNLPGKQKSLIEDLKARPNLPTKQLSRQDFLIWHELFLWLFKILGRQIQFCITARSANGPQDESTEAYKNLWIAAMNLKGMLQRVVVMIEGSSIFGMWAAILQKILDGKGERRTTVGAMIPSAPLPSFAGRPTSTVAGQRQGQEGKILENLRTREKYNGEAQQARAEREQPPLLEDSGPNVEQEGLNISPDPKAGKLVNFGGTIRNFFKREKRQDRELSDKEGLNAGLGIVKRVLGKPITWIRNKTPKRKGLENILNAQKTSDVIEAIASGSRKERPGDDNSRQETQVAVPNQSPDDDFDDPVHQRERDSGGYRSYASLESLTKVVPTPRNSRERSMNDAEEYEDEGEDEDRDKDEDEDEDEDGDGDNEDDEVGYDGFDLRLITEAEKPRRAARDGLFRRAYALADFQFLVRAVLYNKNIATEVVRKDFTVKIVTPVDGSYITSKVENLEETLYQFFASENPKRTPLDIQPQVQDFIKNLDQIIKEGNRRQKLLDYMKKEHTVRTAQHAELVLLQYLLAKRNLGAGK